MKSDTEIRDDVINELYWDPQVTAPEANGHVHSMREANAAAAAAAAAPGIAAVDSHLVVTP